MIGAAIVSGMVAGLGLTLMVRGLFAAPVRLGDALAALERRDTAGPASAAGGVEGVAGRLQRRLRLPLTARQQQLLLMQGRSVGDFFVEKLVWTGAGVGLPTVWAATQWALGNAVGPAPLAAALIGGTLGYFVADVRLRGGAEQERRAATDGLHTFFDLVVLERLANSSAAQAAANAAAISGAPLFQRIAVGLERARMEQTQPWNELRDVAREWNVPELADFADVMQLEEQGAGLAEVLQARVRELRDAHLNAQRAAAQEASEAMTLWMTIPAMILGLALLIPPLLTLLGT